VKRKCVRDLGFRGGAGTHLLLRSQIMICIEQFVERSGLIQAPGSCSSGPYPTQINAALKGRSISSASNALVNTATRAGLHVELHVTRGRSAPRAELSND